MKRMLMLFLILATAAAYDDVDDKTISKFAFAQDEASLRRYFSCLTDRGPCDEFGQAVKSHIAEVLTTGCSKCDFVQKQASHFFITTLRNRFPDLYEAFEEKYDPDRTLLPKLDENLKEFWSS